MLSLTKAVVFRIIKHSRLDLFNIDLYFYNYLNLNNLVKFKYYKKIINIISLFQKKFKIKFFIQIIKIKRLK